MSSRSRSAHPPASSGPLPTRWRAVGLFVGLVTLYAVSAPRTVTLEDSGDFIMASYFAGIPHIPGFPIHTILGQIFTWIPLGSVALGLAYRDEPTRTRAACWAGAYGLALSNHAPLALASTPALLERSVEIHPHPSDNAALPHLLRMYQYAGRSADLEALKKRFARRRASD